MAPKITSACGPVTQPITGMERVKTLTQIFHYVSLVVRTTTPGWKNYGGVQAVDIDQETLKKAERLHASILGLCATKAIMTIASFLVEQKRVQLVEDFEYKVVSWGDFINTPNLPEGLLDRALSVTQNCLFERNWVVYDPLDDDEGWMLIGENLDEIVLETIEHFDLRGELPE